jgi:uncharacterized protein (DUF362 family)
MRARQEHPMGQARVIIRSVAGRPLDEVVGELFSFCNVSRSVGPDTKVLIKPNLCTERADMKHTANTSLAVIESTVKRLRDLTRHITIGESDGARYTVEQAYEANGIYDLAKRYDVSAVNFSREEQVWVPNEALGTWNFARPFLETDYFVTIPALKTHATTVFTGSLKNQWGCVPRKDRLIWHKYLDGLLSDIAKLVPVRLSIMDGIVGMQGRGPINGYPINANLLVAGEDEVAVDATSMRLIGLDPYSSGHVRLAAERGVGAIAEGDIEIDGDFEKLRVEIEPAVQDWAIKLLNLFSRSPFITKTFIMNDHVFYPIRSVVVKMRKLIG